MHDLDLDLENNKSRLKYAYQNPMCDFIFDGSSNDGPICQHFRDSRSQRLHELDFDL